MFFDWFFDVPGAFEVHREDYEVARAKTDRIFIVSNRDFTINNQTSLGLGIGPVKGAGLAFPDWPGFAGSLFVG